MLAVFDRTAKVENRSSSRPLVEVTFCTARYDDPVRDSNAVLRRPNSLRGSMPLAETSA